IYLEKQPGEEPVTIDKITGLHWTSCPSGLTGAGCDGGAALDLELEGALTYCDELSWGGHNDWYLPDMFELISLADLDADASMTTGTTDLLDDHAFPNQQAVPSAFYWSTSLVRHDVTSFSTGQNQPGFSSIAYQQHRPTAALCVRRGFSKAMPAGERFVSHVDAPVGQPWTEDRVTGLVFQGCFSGPDGMCDGKHTGAEAVAHCRDLSWGGADDWRVANYKELQSIFDPNQAGDSPLPEEFFGENGGAYVFAAPGTLLGLNDMERVGIGIPENRYQVLCVRGPYAP
ncbi:MAG: DUF1566 domain-containing protein, partial [Myxococcales bacterium]|nr:DUF1566 domain-containing protein [Myxococcales bacterium]